MLKRVDTVQVRYTNGWRETYSKKSVRSMEYRVELADRAARDLEALYERIHVVESIAA